MVGGGPGAGCAIGGEVGFPGLDVIFRLASPAIDLLVQPAGRALLEICNDEAGVRALIADLDAGDDPLDAAPAFRAVVEGLGAMRLAGFRCRVEAGFGAGLEIGDVTAQCRRRRDAQDKFVAPGLAPVNDFGAAIVTFAVQ